MLERLKHLDLNPMDIDEMVELSTYATQLQAQYVHLEVQPPSWLEVRARELNREIKSRENDRLEKELRDLETQGAADLTAEERRAGRKEKIEALKAKLAGR